jgi:hypothetical protein
MIYDEVEHRHRFASWCAATAARSSPKCRFSVEEGGEIINRCNLIEVAKGWNRLPSSGDFDTWHREQRRELILASQTVLKKGNFTHGVAAKLLNCYLKPLFVTGVRDDLSQDSQKKLDAIHPPIDRVLAKALKNSSDADILFHSGIWKLVLRKGWSSLESDEYESVIAAIAQITNGELWKIESYWQGYQ